MCALAQWLRREHPVKALNPVEIRLSRTSAATVNVAAGDRSRHTLIRKRPFICLLATVGAEEDFQEHMQRVLSKNCKRFPNTFFARGRDTAK
jgi:NTP pyrophosphatase (non-canonical NTP hydrolase)